MKVNEDINSQDAATLDLNTKHIHLFKSWGWHGDQPCLLSFRLQKLFKKSNFPSICHTIRTNKCDNSIISFHIPGGTFGSLQEALDYVLVFDSTSPTWKSAGGMKTARSDHGASLVNFDDVNGYCS